MTRHLKLGLLGHGISRSLAPYLHRVLGELEAIDVRYDLIDLVERPSAKLSDELKRCADQGYDGVNITHPFKLAAYDLVSAEGFLPKGLCSINTVRFEVDRMRGFNTDFTGFCRAYRNKRGKGVPPGRVLIAGAGGVGYALAFGVAELGAEEIILFDQDEQAATRLVRTMVSKGIPARVCSDPIALEMRLCDGLINATPLGMYQYPGCAFPKLEIKQQSWAFDAVYTPMETEFLTSCAAGGVACISGFDLFFFQGLDAFEVFSGITSNVDAARNRFQQTYPTQS